MQQVKHGDLRKASDLFDRYNKALYNFFVKIMFDRDLGHDLTQNVFLRMMKYRKTYRGDKPFKAWLYQIARNVYADHFRKNKIKYADLTDVEQVNDHLMSVDEKLVNDEREKLLYISLYRLNTEQREILILTRFQEMKYEEVSQILDISVANVKVRVHRAMHKLKEAYLQLENI
ncbi:RNA polymerase sigma factor [Fulvivirga sp. M361]|nr:RNA polymerase sigma factor [Fulvivirga sp. M361]